MMSLYYDAVSILTSSVHQGSLKSRTYAQNANLKAKPAHVYALISETAKYDTFLKEVIDNAGILVHEPKLTPLLALLIIHDHFFANGGIAAGASHPLRQSVERHKARLQSEFTKARLKRRVPTPDQLKAFILKEKGIAGKTHPRWARVNKVKCRTDDLVDRYFAEYAPAHSIDEVVTAGKAAKILYRDKHVPDLLAFPPDTDLTKHQVYLSGEIILQDKASCFPAHLLLGNEDVNEVVGDAMDGCAAPGNKTTHMAALVYGTQTTVFACERDPIRSRTLQSMIERAGAGRSVVVLQKQDFLALDPHDPRFANVTHLLLDPSCSGSGIVGREDVPTLALPDDPRQIGVKQHSGTKSNKRKRGSDHKDGPRKQEDKEAAGINPDSELEQTPTDGTRQRLEKLSNLQSRIVEHAFAFPAARRITYSTCSIHPEENENVVSRVLKSSISRQQGWRVIERPKQVYGMRVWQHRGVQGGHGLSEEQREACIRCAPEDGEGTMGFFVCGFERSPSESEVARLQASDVKHGTDEIEDDDEDEWSGFSDNANP